MANLAGGATGTVLAGFYLLRVHDTVIATAIAVTINIIVAIIQFLAMSAAAAGGSRGF
jgi:spermidine synthase